MKPRSVSSIYFRDGRTSAARRLFTLIILGVLVAGCASGSAPAPRPPETLRGVASWYGEEFSGRTTANGEIFDPRLLTAAHRTLPFGTLLEITNPQTRQNVRVRVNDRGPYIGNRIIDLSYAAAQQIGLIEPGIGEVEIRVVRLGAGDREPPAPLEVTIAATPENLPAPPAEPPSVAFPLPSEASGGMVDRVIVEEERGGVITRRQVSPDGRSIEEVPIGTSDARPAQPSPTLRRAPEPRAPRAREYFVQAGAFGLEENAKELQQRLVALGQRAWVEGGDFYRVRIGPFATREEAIAARSSLEVHGMSAIIVAEPR